MILALDVGTEQSAFCFVDEITYKPVNFGKINNAILLEIVKKGEYDTLVYEGFACYGMPVGKSTINSIEWNGRYKQVATDLKKDTEIVYRMEEKMNLCKNMKARDSNIRQALIDRFGEVGTKNKQGWFYGFKADIWSSYAVAVTYLDRREKYGLD